MFTGHKFYDSGNIIFFKLSHHLMLVTWSEHHVVLRMEASLCKSAPCLVWCPWIFCRWIYNVFNLPRDLTCPPCWDNIQIYGWEYLVVSDHPKNFCDHKYCDSGYITFFICHVTSPQHLSSWCVTTLQSLVKIGIVVLQLRF